MSRHFCVSDSARIDNLIALQQSWELLVYWVFSKKNHFQFLRLQTVITFLIYIFIAFLFQNSILRLFEILFSVFLFISPDEVLNIGTQV